MLFLQELNGRYETRIADLKGQVGDFREQRKFNRELMQTFRRALWGPSERVAIDRFTYPFARNFCVGNLTETQEELRQKIKSPHPFQNSFH